MITDVDFIQEIKMSEKRCINCRQEIGEPYDWQSGVGLLHDHICADCGQEMPIPDRLPIYYNHHIWCNLDPRVPPDECKQCIEFFEKYPENNMDMVSKYFPNAVVR